MTADAPASGRVHPTRPGPTEALRYTLPVSDTAVWLGLTLPAVVLLGSSISLAVAALLVGYPIPAAMTVLALGGASALVPVAGQPLIGWLPTLAGHIGNQLPSRRAGSSSFIDPSDPARPGRRRAVTAAGDLPGELRRLRLRALTDSDRLAGLGARCGVVEDPGRGTITAVLAVAGTERFALLDPPSQDQRLASWGSALTALATDPRILRVQWVQRASAHPGGAGGWLADRAARGDPTGRGVEVESESRAEAVGDYLAMTAAVERAAVRHEVWLAVQLAAGPRRDSRDRRRRAAADVTAAGPAPDADADAMVHEQIRQVAATLLGADLLARALSADEIGWLLRRVSDLDIPADPPVDPIGDGEGAPRMRSAFSWRRAWDHLRTDDSVHRSFAVVGWPRLPMPADWLAPLLLSPLPAGVARTVAVHLQPMPPQLAARHARAAQTKAVLDAGDRTRLGFVDTAGHSWAQADAAGLEQELLGGYRMHQLTAVLTVSARSLPVLTDACRSIRAAGAASRIDLRPVHGQHDLALAATLPLATLPGRRS